jgi:hypothetical protein
MPGRAPRISPWRISRALMDLAKALEEELFALRYEVQNLQD